MRIPDMDEEYFYIKVSFDEIKSFEKNKISKEDLCVFSFWWYGCEEDWEHLLTGNLFFTFEEAMEELEKWQDYDDIKTKDLPLSIVFINLQEIKDS